MLVIAVEKKIIEAWISIIIFPVTFALVFVRFLKQHFKLDLWLEMSWINLYIWAIIICLGWCLIYKQLGTNFVFIFISSISPVLRQFSPHSGGNVGERVSLCLFDPYLLRSQPNRQGPYL